MMNDNHQEERSIKLLIGSSIKCLKILKLTSANTSKTLMENHSTSTPTGGNNQQVCQKFKKIPSFKHLNNQLVLPTDE